MELENEIESTESGANEGASPDASESSSKEGSDNDSKLSSAPESKPDTTPFHEHPRFKELVEQKNSALKQYQDLESKYKAMEGRFSSFEKSQPKQATEFDQLLGDLKKVDPRLAAALETQAKAAQEAQTLKERLDQFERQSQEATTQHQIQTAVAKINSMHEANKASPEVKQFINDKLDLMYMQGKLNLQNLDQSYKDIYGGIKKYEEALSRSIRESYVKDKTKDSAVPTSVPKGQQARPPAKAQNWAKDKEQARGQIVKEYLKEQAAQKDAVNS